MLNCCETLYTTSLRDLDKIYLLHQDTDFFQSGLGDIQEISLEVGSGHGYKKKVTIIITRSCESFQITLKICRVNITKCEIWNWVPTKVKKQAFNAVSQRWKIWFHGMYQCRRSITYKSKLKYETPFQDGVVGQSLGDLIFSNTGMVFQECKGPLIPCRLLVNKRVNPHRFIRQGRKLDVN